MTVTVVGAIATRPYSGAARLAHHRTAGGATFEYVVPASVEHLVADAEAIVVARYVGASDAGNQVLTTPEPTPSPGASPPAVRLPTVVAPLVHSSMVVDQIIRNDGSLTVNDTISLQSYGRVPISATETAADAASLMPVIWPNDTEFVLFLRKAGASKWWIPYGADGRILTSGNQVTCSDSARTVYAFMQGLDRDQFIDAVATAAVLVTPYPTAAP
jgi:hypothetical protein